MGSFSKELESCRGQCKDENWCRENGVIAPDDYDSCNNPWKPTETGGGTISLSGKDVCCLVTK